MLHRCGQNYACANWDAEKNAMLNWASGISVKARVGRVAFAVVVYSIWQERNYRIFQNHYRTVNKVLKDVDNYFRARMWEWKIRRSYYNWLICRY